MTQRQVMTAGGRPRPRWAASLMGIGAGVAWSFGALLVRLAKQSDTWQYLLWRSVAIIVVMEARRLLLRSRRPTRGAFALAYTSGSLMIAAHVGLLVASLAYVYAVKTTTAANAAFLASITPLVTIGLARLVLGERLTRAVGVAVVVALAGLLLMVHADVGVGTMIGNLSALASSVGFAGYTVCLRSAPERDWSPVLTGYGSMMVVLCAAVTVAHGRSLVPPAHDIALAVFHGAVLIIAGTLLFNAATRSVPAVAMTVFAQSETVFAPFWVFLVLSERPKADALAGAALILAAVLGTGVASARRVDRRRPALSA